MTIDTWVKPMRYDMLQKEIFMPAEFQRWIQEMNDRVARIEQNLAKLAANNPIQQLLEAQSKLVAMQEVELKRLKELLEEQDNDL